MLSTGSVCSNAVYVASVKKSVDILTAEPAVILFVNEACKHCKTIALGKQAQAFIDATNVKKTNEKDSAVVY